MDAAERSARRFTIMITALAGGILLLILMLARIS
jgi:hypothetical protein